MLEVENDGLPTTTELVENHGVLQGRFLLTAGSNARPTLEQRLVAVAFADGGRGSRSEPADHRVTARPPTTAIRLVSSALRFLKYQLRQVRRTYGSGPAAVGEQLYARVTRSGAVLALAWSARCRA